MTRTNFAAAMADPQVKAQLEKRRDQTAMPPLAVAQAIAYAIDQPDDIDVSEIVIRPIAKG